MWASLTFQCVAQPATEHPRSLLSSGTANEEKAGASLLVTVTWDVLSIPLLFFGKEREHMRLVDVVCIAVW